MIARLLERIFDVLHYFLSSFQGSFWIGGGERSTYRRIAIRREKGALLTHPRASDLELQTIQLDEIYSLPFLSPERQFFVYSPRISSRNFERIREEILKSEFF